VAIAFYRKYGDDGIGRQLDEGVQEEAGDVGVAGGVAVPDDSSVVPPPSYEEATASVAD